MMHGNRAKHVLREVAKGQVPEEVIRSRKWPFSTPRPDLTKGRYRALDRLLETYLSREAVCSAAILRWSGISILRFLRSVRYLRARVDRMLFLLCCLQILHAHFIEDRLQRFTGKLS